MKLAPWIIGALIAGSAAFVALSQGLGGLNGTRAQPFSEANAPPAPDYSKVGAWAARPPARSGADALPDGTDARDNQAIAKTDVFFIYPTTYLTNAKWNAAYDEPGVSTARVDTEVLRNQASAFNGCCRIFAPRYRQATLAAFAKNTPDGLAAMELAYTDVLRAFDYYIAHDNGGRPFIIAGHSQGANHAMRLLQERVAGKPLARRMVAAYVIGSFLPVEIESKGLPICRSPLQTGCVIDWNSIAVGKAATRRNAGAAIMWFDGRYQPSAGHKIVCVNPLNWRADASAPAAENLGAIPLSAGGATGLPHPIVGLTGAACTDGMLEIGVPLAERLRFADPLTVFGIYHDFDYNLYYMNIRQNAEQRAAAFLAR